MREKIIAMALLLPSAAVAQNYTLDDCRRLAIENNVTMQKVQNEVYIANEQRKRAQANFYPQVSASAYAFDAFKPMLSLDVSELGLEQFGIEEQKLEYMRRGATAEVTVVQPVWAGGQIINNHKLAKVSMDASLLKQMRTERDVKLQTDNYFWQVVTLTEKLKTIQQADSMLNQLHKDVQSALDNGLKTRNDLLRVELQQNENAANRSQIEKSLQISCLLLAQFIGVSTDVLQINYHCNMNELPAFPLELKCDHEAVLSQTVDYKLLSKNVEAGLLNLKLEKSKLKPQIGIGASYSYSHFSGINNKGGMVFATMSIPISSWWTENHAVKAKRKELETARAELSDKQSMMLINMKRAWNEVEDAYNRLELAHKSIKQADENLRISYNQYNYGRATMTELLDAQMKTQQMKDKYVDAFAELMITMTAYENAVN